MEKDHVTKKEFYEVTQKLDNKIDRVTQELRDEIQKNGVFLESLDNKIDTVIEMLGTMYEKSTVHEMKIEDHEKRITQNSEAIYKLEQKVV